MDIAVIGMSGIFPEAENLEDFYRNLSEGVDSVRKIPSQRQRRIRKEITNSFGYLDQIDEFDYSFFNLSLSEAEYMDPQQRILLQLVCTSIENSGYSLDEFRKSRTSVILNSSGGPKLEYANLANGFHPTLITGNAFPMSAGRISYYLGLQGPSMMIDTSCSSALTCLHESCNKILLGEVDQAITGGVRVLANLNYDSEMKFGMESENSRCKAFDDSADGIVGGEGGGVVVLKPLDKALADNDNIQSIIKGWALNHDGDRSNGLTAPSPEAQTEVITEAWKKANIDPRTLGYIEAHGTGTRLGDPIEIQGLTDAFNMYTNDKKFCYIGSLKTNIGHLAESSGISSVIKTILSLKYKRIFPSLHFKNPNSHIDFHNTAIKVNDSIRDWEIEKGELRRAAVSSFSLSGTNAHVVLEEPPVYSEKNENDDSAYLFTLSAKSNKSIEDYRENLLTYLNKTDESLESISYVLNKGRSDYSYRYSLVARSKRELVGKLQKVTDPAKVNSANKPLVFLFPHQYEFPEDIYNFLINSNPLTKKIYSEITEKNNITESSNVKNFFLQYLLYRYYLSKGITPAKVVGTGIGRLVVDYITKNIDLHSALQGAKAVAENSIDDDKLNKLVKLLSKEGNPVFVTMSGESDIYQQFYKAVNNFDQNMVLKAFDIDSSDSLIELESKLYLKGIHINWKEYYQGQNIKRTSLPTYPFEKTKCWISDSFYEETFAFPSEKEKENKQEKENDFKLLGSDVTPLENEIAQIWFSALKIDELSVDDDFYEIGGNSLISILLIEKLEDKYDIELDLDILFDYSTIRDLSNYIKSVTDASINIRDQNKEESLEKGNVKEVGNIHPLSYSQESMWYLDHYDPESSSYNIPYGVHLKGKLDEKILHTTLKDIVKRHESLRTIFPEKEGKPTAIVLEEDFSLQTINLTELDESIQQQEVSNIYKEESLKPFNLSTGPLIRVNLIKLNSKENVLIVIMHHIIADNWSFQIFQNELVNTYLKINKGLPTEKPSEYQYKDFAKWQRENIQGENLVKHLKFWSNKLADSPELLRIPTQKDRPKVQSFNGKTLSFTIPSHLISKLERLSLNHDATLFMTLLAGWKSLLYRYTGQEDIVVGVPVAGRSVITENVIGDFVNTLVVRTQNTGNPKFLNFLKVVRKEVLEALKHQELPFNMLVDELDISRTLAYTPVFQVIFDYHHNSMIKELDLPGFETFSMEKHINTVKSDIELVIMSEGDQTNGLFIYNTDIFDENNMIVMLNNYLSLLSHISGEPYCNLLDIHLESENEEQSITTNIAEEEFNF
ncbi:Malonyl CoA-acyl carrier protein transacylase [Bacillus subtilis]|uniref:condensation domain-containing protein n=1 Tax=Bacillus subtilis TaxID=1423 RepID=UPI0005ADF1A3|nr:condensation domain-containing protein [Bacillus subtilis]KIN31505.1 Malonyl CoA-acyl carrier protein transacylase [Bacillus subtilis]KIN56069.1 Malonyl CoA-acyl carrier protein transacylase [Bacillus subtilis]